MWINNINAVLTSLLQGLEEAEMAEDFDELTQSSDTATEDMDSPTSGYRHASLLIQKLDSATLGTNLSGSYNSFNYCHFQGFQFYNSITLFVLFYTRLACNLSLKMILCMTAALLCLPQTQVAW